MKKDFDKWNLKKKNLNDSEALPVFHEREIWWCALGTNIGVEMDGKNNDFERPVLIIKKFNRLMTLIVPLTKAQRETKYHHRLNLAGDKESMVVLSQIRLIGTERLLRPMTKIPDKNFAEIIGKIGFYFPSFQ